MFSDLNPSIWLAEIWSRVSEGYTQVVPWLTGAYQDAPALVLGVAFGVSLPVLALFGLILRAVGALPKRWRQPERAPRTVPLSLWHNKGMLEFVDHKVAPFTLDQRLVRIGREEDNDLCLKHPTVHRYHAVLERNGDAEFHILYLGDPKHGGIRVNGRPVARERLRGGEVLEMGQVKMRFAVSAM